jgi:hypothetical protein
MTLSEEEVHRMESHAGACPDCAVLLEMHAHLRLPQGVELESQVPEHMVAGMWAWVSTHVRERPSRRGSVFARFLVPALAAATLLLVLGNALLLRELRGAQQRVAVLESREQPAPSRLATAASQALRGGASVRWAKGHLADRERISLAEVHVLLQELPPEQQLLSRRDAVRLLQGLGPWRSYLPAETLEEIDIEDGLQAAEMVRIIEALPLDAETELRSARLLRLSERWRPGIGI